MRQGRGLFYHGLRMLHTRTYEAFVMKRAAAFVISAAFVGCRGCSIDRPSGQTDVGRVAIDSIALDSCAGLDRLGRPPVRILEPGEVIPPPHPGSWTDVKRLRLGALSMDVPAGTMFGRTDSAFVALFEFPTCRYLCSVSIALTHDTADRSLDAYVEGLRTLDTIADPDAERDRPGPPRAIRVGPERGLLMEIPCGGCGTTDLVIKQGRTVARISSSVDDREGFQPALMCRLVRATATVRWLNPNANISTRSSNER